VQSFSERILPVDEKVAQNWGRMNARSSFSVTDSLLAATAETHGLILVTRNLKDIERCGVRCLNAFAD
jgi:predicted nucleic acid-binding protein